LANLQETLNMLAKVADFFSYLTIIHRRSLVHV
jgi:hypothetical protein